MYNDYEISGLAPTCPVCTSDYAAGVCLRCLRRTQAVRETMAMIAIQEPQKREAAQVGYEAATGLYERMTSKVVSV